MQLATSDVQAYSLSQLMSLFQLQPGFTEEQLQLSRQRLVQEIPHAYKTTMTRPHEIALFVDCACNRVRDEGKPDPKQGTWEQKANPLLKGTGSQVVQERATVAAGKSAQIVSGRRAETGDVPPGWLNPIGVKTVDIAMNIDSRFRDNYAGTTSSDWSIELPVTQYKVASMRVASLEIPFSFYSIEMAQGNATMLARWADNTLPTPAPAAAATAGLYDLTNPENPLTVMSTPGAFTAPGAGETYAWLIILPDGNYEIGWQDQSNGEDIVKGMKAAIESAIPGIYNCETGRFLAYYTYESWLAVVGNDGFNLGEHLAFEIQRASGRAVFASPQVNTTVAPADPVFAPAPSKIVAVDFAVDRGGNRDLASNLQLKLGWSLGFRVGSYFAELINGEERMFSWVSESICSVAGPEYMYLCIDDGNNNYGSSLVGCFAKSTFNKNIMLRINLAVTGGTSVYAYMGFAGLAGSWWRSRDYFGPVTISKLGFKLYDAYGRILNLNGMDWSMALVFESIYD